MEIGKMSRLFNSYMPDLPKLNEILNSGSISYGAYGNIFEVKLREKLDNQHVLTTSSFFYAISVALSTFDLKAGDEVIMSPLNCLAAVMPYKNYGLSINFVDIDEMTGTLDIDAVKKAITDKTKLIVLSHYCGYQGNLSEFRKLAKEKNIVLINDCFEAFMSFTNQAKNSGALENEAFVYHFGPTKLPNTIDGGCVELFSESYFKIASQVRDLGIDRKQFRKANGEIDENYSVELNSFGALMSEVNSYIGTMQCEQLDKLTTRMRMNTIHNMLNAKQVLKHQFTYLKNQSKTNNWVFGFLSESKDDEMTSLKEQGIACSGVHTTLSHNAIFENTHKEFPNTDSFINKFIAIPNGWWIENECQLSEVQHNKLSEKDLNEIVAFKDLVWTHGNESQRKWIDANHTEDDYHYLMTLNHTMIAYLSLVKVCIHGEMNQIIECRGLSNVCVHPTLKGNGVGQQLIEGIEESFCNNDKFILLCSDVNVPFYSKCGFELYKGELFDADGNQLTANLMVKGFEYTEQKCILEKSF